MFGRPSLITRIAIGKFIGLIFGFIGFMTLPHIWPEADLLIRWGVLLWYVTVGAIIGVFGIFTWHPALKLPMPWWLRAPLLGAWLNFVLTFFAYDAMSAMLDAMLGPTSATGRPFFWFPLEGAIIGLIMGYFATRFGGEGRGLVDEIRG
jgi:hypothetical protein